MTASVLIATRDRAASLARTLETLAAQVCPGLEWEVLVVDNGSRDGTAGVLEDFAAKLPLVALSEPRAGKNRALNRALGVARGELLVFTDDDVLLDPGWLAALVGASRRWPEVTVFGGPIEPVFPPQTPEWIRSPDFVLASEAFGWRAREEEGPSARFPFGANLALRRRIFETQRFDEAIGPGSAERYAQGSEYALLTRLHRQGELFVHVPGAAVRHVVGPEQIEPRWLLGRAERVGRGSARIKGKRVPKSVLGWIPLHVHWLRARLRALLVGGRGPAEQFALAQRVHYWQGYIDESRRLRRARAPSQRDSSGTDPRPTGAG